MLLLVLRLLNIFGLGEFILTWVIHLSLCLIEDNLTEMNAIDVDEDYGEATGKLVDIRFASIPSVSSTSP